MYNKKSLLLLWAVAHFNMFDMLAQTRAGLVH